MRQSPQSRQGQGSIAPLVGTLQPEGLLAFGGNHAAIGIHALCSLVNGAHGLRLLRRGNRRAVPGEDGCFFPGHLVKSFAQILGVVQPDGGQHGHILGHGVGGIQPAAHAGFQHDELHLLLRKPEHGHRQHQLKEGGARLPVLHDGAHLVNEPRGICIRDILPVHADALAELHQMRRGEQPGLVTGSAGHALAERAGAPLAIRAGHVDNLSPRIQHATGREQTRHSLQPQLDAENLRRI